MSRPLRIQFPGAWYHVMNRGVNREKLFFNSEHKYSFFNLLNETKKIYGIEIHAYCLMSNHYHLIIHTPRGNISHAMKYLNSNYARLVNVSMNRDGPLFKGRFKAIIISADDYLIRLSRYIHLNPVKAKIVSSPSLYKWSSYRCYIGKNNFPFWLSCKEVQERFGEVDFFNQYKKFVECTSDEDLEFFYKSNKYQPVLGNDDFRQMIDNSIKCHSLSSEIVGANCILDPPDIALIINTVAHHFNVKPNQIYQTSHAIKNPARRIAIYISRELGGFPLNEIGKVFGQVSYKAISSSLCRVRSDSDQIKTAGLLINKLLNKLKPISERNAVFELIAADKLAG